MARHDADVTLTVALDVQDVTARANELRASIEKIFKDTNGKKNMSSGFVRLKQQMRDLYQQSIEVEQKLANVGDQQVPTKEYAAWTKVIEKANAELVKVKQNMLFEANANGTGTDTYKRLQGVETKWQNRINVAQAEQTKLVAAGQAFNTILAQDTDEYKELVAQQARLNDKMQIAVLRSDEIEQKTKKISHAWEYTRMALRGAYTVLRGFAYLIRNAAGAAKSLVDRMRGVNVSTQDTSKSLKKLVKFALKYFLGLRSIFILYKRIRSAGVEAYKGLASQFSELKAEVDDLKTSFFQLKNSLATMAQPILSYLVPAIKTVMNWLIAAMNALANFFAIFTGQKYIYKATKNNNALAESMKGAGKAAKEANEDIAEYDNLILIQQDNGGSGGGGGGDADQYAGAWEKVEAESDFAQMLRDAIDRGDWEGVGSILAQKLNGVVAKLDNWIVGTLHPKAKEWAKNLGRVINGFADDFNAKALGTTLADAINSAADIANTFLTTTNFDKLGQRVGEFISTGIKKLDIRLIATMIANRLNAAINFVGGLLGEIEFKDIGKKLGEGIVTFFNTVNWGKLGLNVHDLVTGVFDAISTFLKTSDAGHLLANTVKEFMTGVQWQSIFNSMKNLAKSIMTAFFDFVTSVNWEEVFNTVSSNMADMVNGFISFISQAIKVAPWDEMANALASLIENINWTEALSSIADLAGKLVNIALKLVKALATALLTINWYDVADAIANAIANINWGDVLTTLGIAALGLIKALGQAILGLITNPDALITIGVAIATLFGAKAIWARVATKVGPLIAGIFGTGSAAASAASAGGSAIGAAAGGGILSGIKNFLHNVEGSKFWAVALGALTYEGVGKIAGGIAQSIASALGEEKLANEYGKFASKPIRYTVDAIITQFQAAFEKSELTGGSTLSNAIVDMFTGGAYLDDMLETRLDEVNATVEANFQKQLDMLENRVRQGKEISESSIELLKQYRDYDTLVTETMKTNSNHYVEIAKKNAGITETTYSNVITTAQHYVDIAKANSKEIVNTVAQAEETANHYAEIAKQNSGYYDGLQKELEQTSNHYVEIAKKNAEEIINTSVQAQESSNHYVEIAKQNSGYYDKIQKEMEESSNHYVEIAKKNAEAVVKDTEDSTQKMEYAISTVPEFYETTFGQAANNVTNAFSGMNDFFSQTAEGVKKPFSTMATFFHDTFSQSWNGVVDVFKTNTPEFKSIQDSISGSFKTMINGMITGVNNSITNPFTTLKTLISKMKDMTVGDSKIFASLPTINVPKIPKLAQGAVLPANSPFLAVVGDQKQGTNIETPLDTMIEAFRMAMQDFGGANNNQPIVLTLNGKQVAQAVWDEENKRYKQTGVRYRYS